METTLGYILRKETLYLIACVFAGHLIAVQGNVNAYLGRAIGHFPATMVNFFVGFSAIVLATALLSLILGLGGLIRNGSEAGALALTFRGAPWWAYLGGCLGATVVFIAIVSIPRLGVTTALSGIVVGQLLMGLVIDSQGWLRHEPIPLTWTRILGIGLLILGMWLVHTTFSESALDA